MMDYQKIGNGLQVAGIGASALHMVGYLGKDCNPAEKITDGHCPLCKQKGLPKVLREYRINFQESVFLCENPQCIYPLGFESLSNIIVPIDPKDYPPKGTCRKRKFFETSLVTVPTKSCSKPDLRPRCNGKNLSGTHSGQPDFSPSSQSNDSAMESPPQKMGLKIDVQEPPQDAFIVQKQFLSDSESGSSKIKISHQGNKSLSEPRWLQWRNVHALCWLDCILSILVHLKTLKIILTGSTSENSSVIHRLLAKHNQATALVNNCQRGECISEVPVDVLSRAESHLNEIRNAVFAQLQPQLKCKLGEEESPVLAFPLLLRNDPQTEKLFLHSFSWKFECSQCGHQVSDRCQKTLTTFTNIIREWHPLNAVHIAPCNKCNHRTQKRKMVLEKVPSILMMHFAEGLLHSDLMAYSFHFQEDYYQITAVIQYIHEPRHFIAWIFNSDGTWLECNDLHGSYCSRRERFGVPPSEVHIVIWERKPPKVTKELNLELQEEGATEVPLQKTQPYSPEKQLGDEAVDNTPLVCHGGDLSSVDSNNAQNDRSHLLWGFENLADEDEITLTLVNCSVDSNSKPLEDSDVTESTVVGEMLQQQDPGGVAVPPLLENTYAPLHGGQPNSKSTTFIMPTFSSSSNSCSPETIPVGAAVAQNNPDPVQDSSSFCPESLQNIVSKTTSLTSVQETLKDVGHTKEMTATSLISAPNHSSQLFCRNRAKPFVTSWVKGLQGRNHCFMPKSTSAYNKTENTQKPLQKKAVSHPLVKGPSHFGGFLATRSEREPMKSSKKAFPLLPPTISPLINHSVEEQNFGNEGTQNKTPVTSTVNKQVQPEQSHNDNNKAHQLRLQLRHLLKEKKEKHASLGKQANAKVQNRSYSMKNIKEQSQLASQKENDSLQDLLRELQHQIDVEDGKSVNSQGTSMSQCSSSSYDDILSELLSPPATVASSDIQSEEECKYLEMGGCRGDSPVPSEKPVSAQYLDHDYCTPEKENVWGDHPGMFANKSPLKKCHGQIPTKQDVLEDILTSSLMNSIMDDAEVLHYFDENLLSL